MTLQTLYRAFRSYFPNLSASRALFVARSSLALSGTERAQTARFEFPDATPAERESLFRGGRPSVVYWKPTEYKRETCVYNPRAGVGAAAEWKPRGGKHVRWIESTKRAGLRFVGYADKVIRLDHTGWFSDPFQYSDSLFRGVVYQLPARGGRSVFVYGYADPNNDGAALLCFDNDADSQEEAARSADSFAEWNAESERDYQVKETAAHDIEEAREAQKDARAELRQIAAELAACRKRCKNWRKSKRYGALFGAVKEHIGTLRETIKEKARLIVEREENPWSACPQ